MSEVTGFFHAGITVSNMEVSLRFYRDGLGLTPYFDKILDADYLRTVLDLSFARIRAVYLELPGGGFIELLEYQEIERISAASRPCDFGAGHLCLYVEGIAAMTRKLIELGGRPRSEAAVKITAGPNTGATSIYMLDPDGYAIELFEKPPR